MLRSAEMPVGWEEHSPLRDDRDAWDQCLGQLPGLAGYGESSVFSNLPGSSLALEFTTKPGLQEVMQDAFVFETDALAQEFVESLPEKWRCAAGRLDDEPFYYSVDVKDLRWPLTDDTVAAQLSYFKSRIPDLALTIVRNQVAYRDGNVVVLVYHAQIDEAPPLADTDYFLRQAIKKIRLEPPPDLGGLSPP